MSFSGISFIQSYSRRAVLTSDIRVAKSSSSSDRTSSLSRTKEASLSLSPLLTWSLGTSGALHIKCKYLSVASFFSFFRPLSNMTADNGSM
ncbi:MAG: hypothetical protein HA491_01980 [Candidatus Verstraetearchaeota archaeon]|nr:hypothetical protein [Candidatus Verstraetearchaeota archaeon]